MGTCSAFGEGRKLEASEHIRQKMEQQTHRLSSHNRNTAGVRTIEGDERGWRFSSDTQGYSVMRGTTAKVGEEVNL